MSKKQIAAVVAAVMTVLGSLAAGVQGLSTATSTAERLQALEIREGEREKRELEGERWRERIEAKVDRLIERGR